MPNTILSRTVPIEAFTDPKTVFDFVAKEGTTSESGLQIDVSAIPESDENGEMARIGWIPGGINPVDAFTKPIVTTASPLWNLMTSNFIDPKPIGWASITSRPNAPSSSNHSPHPQTIRAS